MRILHILDHSLPFHSGYTFRTLSIIREQLRLGLQPYLLTSPKQNSGSKKQEEVEGWRFYRTPYRDNKKRQLPAVSEILLMQALARRIQEVAEDIRPDLIHAHSPVLNGLPALRVASQLGLPLIYEVRAFWEDAAVEHGTESAWGMRYRATRAAESFVLRRADAVTTICNGLRQEIIGRGVENNRVRVIPNAVDLEHFTYGVSADAVLQSSLGLKGNTVLGFAGSFYSYEGIDLLLRALPLIHKFNRNVKVLLVGGGPEEKHLRDLAKELDLGESVIFTGRIQHEDMPRYYGLINILVYPRVRQRLTELVTPLKPLEAMAQGKLVAASNVGGHRELIEDQVTGFLFEPEKPEALANCVANILNNQNLLEYIRSNALKYVGTERTWKNSVSRYIPIYEKLADCT